LVAASVTDETVGTIISQYKAVSGDANEN